jgi:Lactonase, 7-bladed beta-propeller
VSIYRIERQTGELTEVSGSPTTVGIAPAPLAFTRDGRFLYVGNGESETISAFGFNPSTGSLTPVAGSPFPGGLSEVSGLDVTPDGRFLYVANHSEADPSAAGVTAFAIGSDGALHPLTPPVYPAGPFPDDLKVSSDGHDLYMTDGNDLRGYAIAGDGSLHEVPGSPFPVSGTETLGLAVAPTPPAPAPPASGGGGSSSSAATPTTPLVPPSTQGTVPGSGPMRLFGARILRASHRRVRVRVRCAADLGFSTCAASLRIRARAGRSLVTAARRSLELSAGQTLTVALRLSETAWRLLVRGDALRATLLLTPDGRPTEPTRIRLAGPEH